MKKKLIRCVIMSVRYSILVFCVIVAFSSFLTAKDGYGQGPDPQKVYISLDIDSQSVTKVFEDIEQQTAFRFVYNPSSLGPLHRVTINTPHASVMYVLTQLSDEMGLEFKQINNYFSVRKIEITRSLLKPIVEKEVSVIENKMSLSQVPSYLSPDREIKGIVTDEKGNPLAGVTVQVKGETTGTVTDAQGKFVLVISGNVTLVVSSIGFQTQEIMVGSKTDFTIKMEAAGTALNQVVVVGYGTQTKKDVTGAVSSANLSRAQDLPNTNILETLQGTLAGINVTPNGRPGSAGSVLIRGQRSISASNSPLIVLDGVIFDGSLADINPEDIASVDVLKDVSSSAIYGSRGANGVILVTTKRGTTAKPTINFSVLYGRSDYAKRLPLLNRTQYLQKVVDYQSDLVADGLKPQAPGPVNIDDPEEYLQNPREKVGYANGTATNWQDVVRQPAPQVTYNLSASGKSKNTNYFISGNYTNQKGIMLDDNFERLSFRVNLENDITSWLRIGMNSFYEQINQSGIPSTLVGQLSLVSPLVKPRDSLGNIIEYPMDDQGYPNPIENSLGQNLNLSSNLEGTMYADVDIPYIRGLNYRINWSNTLFNSKDYTFWNPDTYNGKTLNGTGSRDLGNSLDSWLDNIVTYKRRFEKNFVDLTLVYSYNKYHAESSDISASNFSNTVLGYNGLSLGGTQSVGQSASSYINIGSMARLNYSYEDRYLITGTIRRDGYSAFGPNKKFGVFPSLAIGWIVSDEAFMKKVRLVDFLKLRYSYGVSGNQGISPYRSLAHVANNAYVFGDVTSQTIGQYVSSLSNASLGWETTLGSNYGLDLNILQNRILLTADYYHYHTKNLLLERAIPSTTGFSTVLSNIGATANSGLEITIKSNIVSSKNFKWTMSINLSTNKNRITHLYGTIDPTTGKEKNDISNRWFIGHPVNTIYDYVFDGIYQVGEPTISGNSGLPGYRKAKDIDHNDTINANDRSIIGTGDPEYRAGINNTFQYKEFTFSFFINSVHGGIERNNYLDPNYYFASRGNYLNVGWWTPSNKSNTRPSLTDGDILGMGYYQSKSIIRVQDISLSYSFPAKLLDFLKVNSFSVFVSAKNPFMFTKWTGYDPEIGNSGFPNYKTLAVGLNLSF